MVDVVVDCAESGSPEVVVEDKVACWLEQNPHVTRQYDVTMREISSFWTEHADNERSSAQEYGVPKRAVVAANDLVSSSKQLVARVVVVKEADVVCVGNRGKTRP